jgi:hypothetical protein
LANNAVTIFRINQDGGIPKTLTLKIEIAMSAETLKSFSI